MPVDQVISLGIIMLVLAASTFALCFGSLAERSGAAANLAAIAVTWTAQALLANAPVIAFLTIDLSLAAAFACLTFSYPEKLWPGVAGCAQLLVVVFTATRMIEFPLSEGAYIAMLNLSGALVAGALALGTWATRWRKKPMSDWDLAYAREA